MMPATHSCQHQAAFQSGNCIFGSESRSCAIKPAFPCKLFKFINPELKRELRVLLDRGRATAKRESVEQAGSLSIAIELTEPIGDLGETVR
jgi:hypothetical protein